jgi:hypothetical protein
MQMEPEIPDHLVNESDFNCTKMHSLNHLSDPFCKLGNPKNTSSELPEWVMIDFKQLYWQWKCDEATFQILQIKARKEVFQYGQLNAHTAKQHHDDIMPLTKAHIYHMIPKPATSNQDPTWIGSVVCMANLGATELHCLVIQEIGRHHRLH